MEPLPILKVFRGRPPAVPLAASVLCLLLLGAAAGLCAEAENPPAQQIDIRSDRLLVDNQNRIAQFSGHVFARQGDTTIEAERLVVHYKEGGGESADALERIVATGNVRIRFENGLAVTPEAVYNMDTRVFVLMGAGSKVTSGKSHISGERITLRRDDGQVTVEGSESRQVEAVFFPEDKQGQRKNEDQPDKE